jgi:hypothetical protein
MAKHIRNTHGVGSEKVRCEFEGCGFGEARSDRWLAHVVEVHAGIVGEVLYRRGVDAWDGESERGDSDDDVSEKEGEDGDSDGYEVE